MKLFRSELASEFKEKLFDIESVEISDEIIVADVHNISCTLSVEKTSYGYQLHGKVHSNITLQCDRCLNSFLDSHDIPVTFWLTADRQFKDSNEGNVVHFDANQEYLDLSDLISESVVVDIPFKILCSDSCKGLCDQCGEDLNKNTCQCEGHTEELFEE